MYWYIIESAFYINHTFVLLNEYYITYIFQFLLQYSSYEIKLAYILSPNPLLMYSAYVKDSEKTDRWLAALSSSIVH